MTTLNQLLTKLQSYRNPKNIAGMAKFGINPDKTLGIPIPILRKLAVETGKDHKLAIELYKTGFHEAKILASMIDDYKLVTSNQMEDWVKDFDSWDVVDQICSNLFAKTDLVYDKINSWYRREEEFVKRSAFALMACLAVHNKKAPDSLFINFLPIIKKCSSDERNYVKKAVNWALRQIGKRNHHLNQEAINTAQEILNIDNKTAKWIASDAIRELTKHKFYTKKV